MNKNPLKLSNLIPEIFFFYSKSSKEIESIESRLNYIRFIRI